MGVIEIGTVSEREAHRKLNEHIDAQIGALKEGLERFRASLERQILDSRLATLEAPLREKLRGALDKEEKNRSGDEKKLLEEHQKLTEQLLRGIEAHYATGNGTLNDPLQVEVDVGIFDGLKLPAALPARIPSRAL